MNIWWWKLSKVWILKNLCIYLINFCVRLSDLHCHKKGLLEAKFRRFFVKGCKKSALKHSTEKPILLNFVSLSTTFCQILSEKTDFHFWLGPAHLILHFPITLVFQKTYSLSKLIFRTTQMKERPKYGIFQKSLSCTFASRTNLGLKAVPIAAGQYLWRGLRFSTKTDLFGVLMNFERSKK